MPPDKTEQTERDKRKEKYMSQVMALSSQIAAITSLVETHKQMAMEDSFHYGYIGDLAHVSNVLGEAVTFLMGED